MIFVYGLAGIGILGCLYGMYNVLVGNWDDPNDPGPF